MTNSIFDPLACISRERDATRNFIDILCHEQAALQQPGASLLLSIANEKAHQAQQFAQLADARNYWLRKLGYTLDQIGMERGLRDCPAAADVWKELLQLAETASQLDKINGVFVGQRLRYTSAGDFGITSLDPRRAKHEAVLFGWPTPAAFRRSPASARG